MIKKNNQRMKQSMSSGQGCYDDSHRRHPINHTTNGRVSATPSINDCLSFLNSVMYLTEKCIQRYKTKHEVIEELFRTQSIDPEFTNILWNRLEKENPEFFKHYYIRLKFQDQINTFLELLERQKDMMMKQQSDQMKLSSPTTRVPLAPICQNTMHPFDNQALRYPTLPQPSNIPAIGHQHLEFATCEVSNSHVVNGVQEALSNNYDTIWANSENGAMSTTPQMQVEHDMAFTFDMETVDEMPYEQEIPPNMESPHDEQVQLAPLPESLQLQHDGTSRPLDIISWNVTPISSDFSQTLVKFSNLQGLEAPDNYPNSLFIEFNSNIMAESSNHMCTDVEAPRNHQDSSLMKFNSNTLPESSNHIYTDYTENDYSFVNMEIELPAGSSLPEEDRS